MIDSHNAPIGRVVRKNQVSQVRREEFVIKDQSTGRNWKPAKLLDDISAVATIAEFTTTIGTPDQGFTVPMRGSVFEGVDTKKIQVAADGIAKCIQFYAVLSQKLGGRLSLSLFGSEKCYEIIHVRIHKAGTAGCRLFFQHPSPSFELDYLPPDETEPRFVLDNYLPYVQFDELERVLKKPFTDITVKLGMNNGQFFVEDAHSHRAQPIKVIHQTEAIENFDRLRFSDYDQRLGWRSIPVQIKVNSASLGGAWEEK